MIEIIHDKVLSVTTDSPDDITTVIDKYKIDNGKVLIPFNLGNVHILKNMGFTVPSPIETRYGWPGLHKPFSHQRSIASFLTLNRRAYNFGELGIGKTKSAIWAADYLLSIGAIRRVLVIAPLSILDSAWKQEIFRTVMHRSVDVAHGTKEKREAIINSKAEFILINYDGVEIVIDALDRGNFDLIIIDECFVAGTRVLTPIGFRAIEQIVEGDIIETSWGPRPVTKTFHKQSSNIVEVEFEDGIKITCTEEHPFSTRNGWVAAKDLLGEICTTSRELSHLRDAVRAEGVCQPEGISLLFSRMLERVVLCRFGVRAFRKKVSKGKELLKNQPCKILQHKMYGASALCKSYGGDSYVSGLRRGAFCTPQSVAVSSSINLFPFLRQKVSVANRAKADDGWRTESSGEASGPTLTSQGDSPYRRAQATTACAGSRVGESGTVHASAGRQWYGYVKSRVTNALNTPRKFPIQLYCKDITKAWKRVSLSLQAGFRRPFTDDLFRSRRVQPQYNTASRTRQEERGVASGLRVVSVTRIQQGCPRDVWNLEVAGPHDYIVEDVLVHNCNYIKNVQTRKHKFINKLIKADTWCWLMTATPAAQSPCDAYGLARMIDPKSVPRSYGAFREMVQYKINMFMWINKPDAERTVHRVLQPAIRFTKSECLDLPELLYETREVPLTAQQNKYYKLLKKEMMILAAGTTVTAANAAVLIGKLLQISAGNCYDERGDIIEFDISNRFRELCDIIRETRNKTIVFVQFRNSIERIMRMLQDEGITCEAIHGKIPMNKRDVIFSDFQNKPDPQVLIIQPQAAAHGVTLTKADTTIWFGVPMSFEIYQQGNGRTHRAGQRNQCTVVHLIGSDVEKKVLNALDKKNMSATTLLALFKEVIK